ncbi:MAG: DoxX family protein [Gammaproteobacteria bacterium]|nr:DoxX family protein [Gammaproteobacteria bacterium]MDH3505574.1 DoxX family protein [Gammaproteobacteria bacterium]
MLTFFERHAESGHLILRVGLGFTSLFLRGIWQLAGGPERWEQMGGAMAYFGITFAPVFWGLLASLAEAVGGLCLMIGLFVRPAAAILIVTMFVICVYHLNNSGTLLMARAHAVELGIGYMALLFMGAGKYSLDRKFGLGS